MYLTFTEYCEYGGTLNVDLFAEYEYEAERIINKYTYNRLVNDSTYTEPVKRTVYKLISILDDQTKALTDKGAVTSQSNDGVSVSYGSMSQDHIYEIMNKKISDTINQYLYGVRNQKGRRLLYRGIYPHE